MLIWPSVLFYILQLVWYVKICGMVVNYKDPFKKEAPEKNGKKNEQLHCVRGGGAVPTYLDVDEEITTIQYPGGGQENWGGYW